MLAMLLMDDGSPTLDDLLALVPGAVVLDLDESILTADPDDPYPTPYGDHPPLSWLTTLPEGFGPDDPPYIDEHGRIAALAWPYDRCHVGYTDAKLCVTLPPSPTGNHMFHQGNTITAEAVQVATGFLGLHGHDQDPAHTVQQAQAFYNDPQNSGARGRILETPDAAYFVGAIKPGVTHGQVETIRGGALSGDWRWIPEIEAYDALGPCLVARPGMPSTYRANAGALELMYQVTQDDSGMIRSVPTWVPRTNEEIQAMAKTRKQLTIQAGGKLQKVQALAEGMTYQDQREILSGAVRYQYGAADDVWGYLVDFDDAMVIYESEADGSSRKMMVGYSISGADVTFVGEPVEVLTSYAPITGESVTASASSCSCKPKRPVQADGSGDLEAKVNDLEILVAELQVSLARYEAEQTSVDDIVNMPDEDLTGEDAPEPANA